MVMGDKDRIVARVRAYILRHELCAAGDMVVAAVSGGADSLCLLYILHELAPLLGLRLHVAHLDHALRPGSAGDTLFVAAQARALGLPYTVDRLDVGAMARHERLSVETAARTARYLFLRAVAAAEGARVITTGHTRDDQAETVLMHLARGSGLNGVAGMAPRRDDIARPLLEISHAEALAYCAAEGLAPREDESNRSAEYRRNGVRHAVLPRLDELYPGASANIARAARLLADDLTLIERLGRRALDDAILSTDVARVELSALYWNNAEPELRPHMLRLLLDQLLGDAAGFDERTYTLMLAACAPHAPDTTLTLPKVLTLVRRGDTVTLGRPEPTPPPPLQDAVLPIPGQVATEVGLLRADRATAPHDWSSTPPDVAYLDPVAAGSTLTVRAWRPGDRVRPLGMAGTRKVQDLFVDRKVPRARRRRIPIVEGTRGIAWVAGLCIGEEYRVAGGAEAVRLTWEFDTPSIEG